MTTMCHCGKPLHYNSKDVQEFVEKQIKDFGEYIEVVSSDYKKSYKVPRHYIALHGIEERKLPTYGFEEL